MISNHYNTIISVEIKKLNFRIIKVKYIIIRTINNLRRNEQIVGNDHFVRNNHPRNVKRNKKKRKKKNSLSNPIYHSSLTKANSPHFRKSVSNDFARSKTGLIALFKTDKTFTHKASRIVERKTNSVIHLDACYLLSRKDCNLIYSKK